MFSMLPKSSKPNAFEREPVDIEDTASTTKKSPFKATVATVTKRKRGSDTENQFNEEELNKTWREVLGNPPPIGTTRVSCLIDIQIGN